MTERAPQHSRLSMNTSMSPNQSRVPRWVWVLLMLLTAGLVGGVAGLLAHAAGDNIPGAILTGGGAFAGTVGLLLAIAHYVGAQ